MRITLRPAFTDERVGGPGATWTALSRWFKRAGHSVFTAGKADAHMLLMGTDPAPWIDGSPLLLRTSGCSIADVPEHLQQDGRLLASIKEADVVCGAGPFARDLIRRRLDVDIGPLSVMEGADHEIFQPAPGYLGRPTPPILWTAAADWDGWPGRRLEAHAKVARLLGWPLHVVGKSSHSPEGCVMHGQLRHPEMAVLYRANPGVFLMAQWLHSWPHIVAEAMMSGLPVIHAGHGGTDAMVRNAGIHVAELEPWDFEAVGWGDPAWYPEPDHATLAERCFEVWDHWRHYSNAAFTRARRFLTWEKAAARYLELMGVA